MKKSLAWTLAAGIVLSLSLLPAYGQIPKDAQQALNKMIDASGGRKYLETLKDTTTTGTAELPQFGMSGTFTTYNKEPNKFRMDMEIAGMVITQAYDGQKAWGINPQTGVTEEAPEEQAKQIARQALGNDALLNPQKYGITYALKPKAKIQDKEYLVLEQTMSDGHKTTMYLDPTTYLPYKLDTTGTNPQTGTESKVEVYMTDYRKFGEGMVAYSIRQVVDGADFVTMTISKITYNAGLEDSMFSMSK